MIYKYNAGVLEAIPCPAEWSSLIWGPYGGGPGASEHEDYTWLYELPCEFSGGFRIQIYAGVSERVPYPFMAVVGFGDDFLDQIHFGSQPDLIRYAQEHAALLQVTMLENIADQISDVRRWLFDSECGLFSAHVRAQRRRQQRAAEARQALQKAPQPVPKG